MSKRNISYIKPEEPKFLRELKAQAGYVEPDTIETKRESLSGVTDEDVEDKDEEQPVVVVLKPGDLSAEEVAQLQVKEQEVVKWSERIILAINWTADDGETGV
uniref:DUF4604 domain-containing protein n=1 Tax=Timema poppense TaxID=170557 RepID=A0A7R9GS61_TIMPO|nr:unnamed protein product [Timema poppensis]